MLRAIFLHGKRACSRGPYGPAAVGLLGLSLIVSSAPGGGQPPVPASLAPAVPLTGVPDPHLIPNQYLVLVDPPASAKLKIWRPEMKVPGLAPEVKASMLRQSLNLQYLVRDLDPKRQEPEFVYEENLIGFSAEMTPEVAKLVDDYDGVRVFQNQWVHTAQTIQPNPPTGLDRIGQVALTLDYEYAYSLTGKGVHVYVIDSGIYPSEQFKDAQGNSRIETSLDLVKDGFKDSTGHGTHVAGIIGGRDFGVAKSVTLHSIHVIGEDGKASTAAIIKAVEEVTVQAQKHPEWRIVANMSLVTPRYPPLDQVVQTSINNGVTYVAAAGNRNSDYPIPDACRISPAHLGRVITVGNIYPGTLEVAGDSFFGSCVKIFAPGMYITSATATENAEGNDRSGTSMAAAHVSGVAALYLETTLSRPDRGARPCDVWYAIRRAGIGFPNVRIWPWNSLIHPGSPNRQLYWDARSIDGLSTGLPDLRPRPWPCLF